MIVLASAMSKGGTGKSTTLQNWAVAALRASLRISVIDADVGQWSTLDWAQRRRQIAPQAQPEVLQARHPRGRDIPKLLDHCRRQQDDLVLIDCQPSRGELQKEVLKAADAVVLVLRPTRIDVDAFARTWAALNSAVFYGRRLVVFNQVPTSGRTNTSAYRELFAARGLFISPSVIHHRIGFERACALGSTILEAEPTSKGAGEIGRTWEWLETEIGLRRRSPVSHPAEAATLRLT